MKRKKVLLKLLCPHDNSELEKIRLDFDMLALTCIVSGECILCGEVCATVIDVDSLIELSQEFWRRYDTIDPSEEKDENKE